MKSECNKWVSAFDEKKIESFTRPHWTLLFLASPLIVLFRTIRMRMYNDNIIEMCGTILFKPTENKISSFLDDQKIEEK